MNRLQMTERTLYIFIAITVIALAACTIGYSIDARPATVYAFSSPINWWDDCPPDQVCNDPTLTPMPTYTPEPEPTCRPTQVCELWPTATSYPTSTPYPVQP